MRVAEAMAYFNGKKGKRLNCAEAIGQAFYARFALSQADMREFSRAGVGRAPEGMCGALYAGRYILNRCSPADVAALECLFVEQAGARACRQVRRKRQLACAGCVAAVAGFLNGVAGTLPDE